MWAGGENISLKNCHWEFSHRRKEISKEELLLVQNCPIENGLEERMLYVILSGGVNVKWELSGG